MAHLFVITEVLFGPLIEYHLQVGTIAVVGVLMLAARLPLVHPDGLPSWIRRFEPKTESTDTGEEFTYSLLHEKIPRFVAQDRMSRPSACISGHKKTAGIRLLSSLFLWYLF